MEKEKVESLTPPTQTQKQTPPMLSYNDPLVIGASALALGYTIGSGRWDWLAERLSKMGKNLGRLTLVALSQSLQSHNPQVFNRKPRIVH